MGIMKCSFSLVTVVVIAQCYEKMAALIMSPANCEIPVLSDDGAGNLLKAEPMCTMKTIVADCPW